MQFWGQASKPTKNYLWLWLIGKDPSDFCNYLTHTYFPAKMQGMLKEINTSIKIGIVQDFNSKFKANIIGMCSILATM